MTPITVQHITQLVGDTGIRASLRLMLCGRAIAMTLLEYVAEKERWWADQVHRRDRDLQDLRGRRSVELEGAAREAFSQGFDSGRVEDADVGVYGPELDLPKCFEAAAAAKPREVLGELGMQAKARGF